jgi:hypothetical protein
MDFHSEITSLWMILTLSFEPLPPKKTKKPSKVQSLPAGWMKSSNQYHIFIPWMDFRNAEPSATFENVYQATASS